MIPRHRRFRTSARTVAMLVGICLQAWPGAVSGFAQDPEDPRGASWMLRVLDKESGVPLGGVLVSSPGLAESRVTDSLTQAEVRAVPAVAEADIFRSLQSLSGVTSISDFGAEMFVRGGDADQVAVLLDGAPVSSALITCSGCSTRTPSSGPARCHERRPSLGPRQMAGGRAKSRC